MAAPLDTGDPNQGAQNTCPPNLGERVGERVRKARQEYGMSRRFLSEKSGISSRYLAQLETGDGNISVGLLQRLAQALDCRVEWFVAEVDPWDGDSLCMLRLYQRANGDVQNAVRSLLMADPGERQRAGRICLIGLRGAGKSTLGAMLSEKMNLPFVELTDVIEEMAGMPLSEIMAFYGQEGYRKLESQALEKVSHAHDRLILAVAGGIVAEPATFDRLLGQFRTIWLRASPVEHMVRVRAQGDLRPVAENSETMDQLKMILANRETQYSRASAQLDTSGQTPEASLRDLHQLVKDQNFLAMK